ncbi:hypothetical protein [Kitasatospora herbaricolor]|uniref:Secreted protein n=1 Tax=Kitasatospora herbaricolor TaxID=68217 RepID=A0ABZ1W6N3_9ACTN|nr:hypothetical protein [Kitasatospora herbaricolor]
MSASVAKRISPLRALAFAGALAAASLLTAGTAAAEGNPVEGVDWDTATSSHKCADQSDQFRFRFYYNSNQAGAWINIGHSVYDLKSVEIGGSGGGYQALYFCDKGNGAGQYVANNAASAYNWFLGYCATVHYNSGYRGAEEHVYPNNGINLTSTKNNNRSINFEAC